MLLLIFALSLIVLVGELILERNHKQTENSECIGVIAGFILITVVVISNFVFYNYSKSFIVDERIEMYQTQNTKIERDISDIVESYKDYESSTFVKCKSNPTLALSMYPELKSNTLVTKEIDVYVKNNNKIKSLQDQKIKYGLCAWWLYFGN